MNRFFTMAFSILIVFISLSFSVAAAPQAESRTISVRGEALLSLKPDLAIVTFGVISEAPKVAAALDANNQAMQKVFDSMKGLGIEDRDVRTSGFSVSPQYESGRVLQRARKIVGYSVQNRVTVRLRDLSKIGGFMTTVIDQGVNRFHGFQFTLEETPERLDQLRKVAVQDAMRKAKILADSAGVKLGKVLRITEGQFFRPGPRPLFAAQGKASSAVPIAPGESTLRVSVSVEFGIE